MLSAANRSDNAHQLATFFARVCIASANRPQELPSSIESTGWRFRQTQAHDAGTTLDVWQLPGVELVHGGTPITARAADVWICSMSVDANLAPSASQSEAALKPYSSRDLFDAHPGDWHWKPSILTEAHITITNDAVSGRQMIFLELADIHPLSALFGS